ncbi:PASTA domain-containing protein [bacterium]|nr:PASTA domain-containing protein [bacterium]
MAQQKCYNCEEIYELGRKQCRKCESVLLLHDRYIVRRVLGRGGFAVVYEAFDTRVSNRRVAIKKVSNLSPNEQQTIVTEVEILAGNASRFGFIPSIYDILREKEHTYIVMEYINGPTLNDMPRPWKTSHVEYFLHSMLSNLEQLHAARIIHRDLKPDNIKFTPNGRAPYTVLDFGISKYGKGRALKALSPDFSAPEQTRGLEGDARSDLFGLGATAYFLLTNMYLTEAVGRGNGNIPSLSKLGIKVGPAVDQTLLNMLALDPAQRPPTAAAARALLGTLPPQHTSADYLPPMPPRAATQTSNVKDSVVNLKPPPRNRDALSLPILLISGGSATLLFLFLFVVFSLSGKNSTTVTPPVTAHPTQEVTVISVATTVLNRVTDETASTQAPVLATSTPIVPTTRQDEVGLNREQATPTTILLTPIITLEPTIDQQLQPVQANEATNAALQQTVNTQQSLVPPTPLPLPTELPPTPSLSAPQPVSVPNVVGLLAGDAYSILGSNGLQGTQFEQSVPGCAPFAVVSQAPPAGAPVQPGSIVTFGVCPQGPLVPAVVGLQIEEARAILAVAGFTVNEVTYGDSRFRNGYVGDQNPPPGQPAQDGVVTLSVIRNENRGSSGSSGNSSGGDPYP